MSSWSKAADGDSSVLLKCSLFIVAEMLQTKQTNNKEEMLTAVITIVARWQKISWQ